MGTAIKQEISSEFLSNMEAIFQLIEGKSQAISVVVLLILLVWESVSPFFAFFKASVKDRLRHGWRNILMGIINALMISSVFIALWLWAAELAETYRIGLLYWLPVQGWVHAFCAVLLFDFWTYWWHRINHEIPFFWKIHRVHHSDAKMDVTTANRFHIGEIFFSSVFRIILILAFGAKLWHLAIYESLMFPIVQFHHANIGVTAWTDRILRILIVTPAMHKVHHSRIMKETNSNYTSFLSLWDRIFCTFRLRRKPHEIHFGLEELDDEKHQSLSGLIRTPLVKKDSSS